MNIRTIQKISLGLGLTYLAIGILGFIPGITVEDPNHPGHGLLLGIFAVNPIHNLVHLLAGLGLIAAGMSASIVRPINRLMALVFGLLVPASMIAPIVEGVAINGPDTMLHLVTALTTAYLGFAAMRDVEDDMTVGSRV